MTVQPLPQSAPAVVAPGPASTLSILYGSQTGNGEQVAQALADSARSQGYAVKLSSLADYKPASLKRESLLALVVSTHGEGDPPDDAELFHEYLLSESAPRLGGLQFTVLALGDSSYVNFCETGRQFDQRLAELGAARLSPIAECDLDYEAAATGWAENLMVRLPELLEVGTAVPQLRAVENAPRYDKQHPFKAEVLVNQKITGSRSSKEVRHIELSIEGSDIDYAPGDSLAVIPQNPPRLVAELMQALGYESDTVVVINNEERRLADVLLQNVEITALNLGFLRSWADISQSGELQNLLDDDDAQTRSELLESHQIIDVVRRFEANVVPQDFVDSLRKLGPRSYSIASSLPANPGEVHLTVAAVHYEAFGREHWGAASTQLADRLSVGDTVPVFLEPNTRFRLPADAAPIIMIGPGTGVAPFRAFVEERAERAATGGNWLIFGDRTFADDFLYQLEWQRFLKHGQLDRLDVAFSRDQEQKVYVQDRLRENARDVYAWIQAGAYIYVCGDAKRMAGDVHDALVDIIAGQRRIDRDAAEQQLKDLRRAGRYQKDVY